MGDQAKLFLFPDTAKPSTEMGAVKPPASGHLEAFTRQYVGPRVAS